jgi:hypothetical protein
MRSVLAIASLLFSTLLLFAVVTPDPVDVRGDHGNRVSSFTDSDADFALCSSFAAAFAHHLRLGYLLFVAQVFSIPTLTVSSNFYRRPPPTSIVP